MKPSRYLSDELEILMGEWVAYSAIDHYYKYTHPEFYPDFKNGDMSQKEVFETVCFETEHDSRLTNSAFALDQVGISFNGPAGLCKYEDIKETIRQNIDNLGWSFIAYFDAVDVMSERKYFKIEAGCKPLMDQFISEGFCTYLDDRYFWTSKIRPILEVLGYWEGQAGPSKDEEIFASLSSGLIKKLNFYGATNQLIMAVKTVKDAKNLDLKTAKSFIENFMFPEQWGNQHHMLIHWSGPDIGPKHEIE